MIGLGTRRENRQSSAFSDTPSAKDYGASNGTTSASMKPSTNVPPLARFVGSLRCGAATHISTARQKFCTCTRSMLDARFRMLDGTNAQPKGPASSIQHHVRVIDDFRRAALVSRAHGVQGELGGQPLLLGLRLYLANVHPICRDSLDVLQLRRDCLRAAPGELGQGLIGAGITLR